MGRDAIAGRLKRLAMEPPIRLLVRSVLKRLPARASTRGLWDISDRPGYLLGLLHAARRAARNGIGAIYPGEHAPSVMLTTLPGEEHQLGLLMAQACLAVEGVHCVSLGIQTPAWDIAEAARQRGAHVVGLSFSQALRPKIALAMLRDLRARLPASVEVWAGGALWERTQHALDGVRFVSRLEQIRSLLGAYREQHASRKTAS